MGNVRPFGEKRNSIEMGSQRSPLPAGRASVAELRLQGNGSLRERGRVGVIPLFLRGSSGHCVGCWLRGDNGPGFLWLAHLFALPLVAPTLRPCLLGAGTKELLRRDGGRRWGETSSSLPSL